MAERCLLAVFAHPDDEAYRPGGTLALLARRGVRVQVLVATRGQAGLCGEPPLCTIDDLPVVRERELRCACAALCLEPPRLLDYQDRHLDQADPESIIAEVWEAKLAAIRCHATQLGTSPITRASRERQRVFLGMEFFVRVALKGGNDFLVGLEEK